MQDIEHWEEELAKEKKLVGDRRKARRYLNQSCVYICRTSSECYKEELERPLYVYMCVSLWLFSGSPVFSAVAATANIAVVSSDTTTFKPHVTCLSLSPSFVVECSTRTISEQTGFFSLVLFLFSIFIHLAFL